MMVYKISLTAWTASFRYPNLISGYQPTLLVPPISTVLGLINAAAGRYLDHQNLEFAYRFEYTSREIDLEKIYMMEGNKKGSITNRAKSNVLKREFLSDVKLDLYFRDQKLLDYFEQPFYSLVIGRSGDLATVVNSAVISLKDLKKESVLSGQVIPFGASIAVPGIIQPLPIYFSDELPRKNLGTRPFVIVDYKTPINESNLRGLSSSIYCDGDHILYFHHIKNNELKV